MKLLLLFLYLWAPVRQETSLEVFVTCRTPEIFRDYRNYNYKQEISLGRDGLRVRIKSRTLTLRHLNHRLRPDEEFIAAQAPEVRRAFAQVRQDALSIADYLQHISLYLKNRVVYSEDDLPQEAPAVLAQEKGHCIGFANVAQALLACAGLLSRPVNGFYLREEGGRVEPVPHRWLEIDLPGQRRVFYDPQYQDFSSRYLVTRPGLAMESVERFAGVIVRKNRKILDE
ncbi:MAG: transglutaminase domain-containing protein [Candidatus Aminicenantes bacterium]|nr:transglutaminase domain-containing protein [Candidatus Aminicenantes bacterium]